MCLVSFQTFGYISCFRAHSFGIFWNKNIFRNIFRLFCSWEQTSQTSSRIARMKIQVFRNENSSQTNAYSHYSNYSYSGLIPNKCPLRFNKTLLLIFQILLHADIKGPKSATPLFLFTCANLAIVFYSKQRNITVKLLKIIEYTFRNTAYSKTIRIASPCYINNFDVIEIGGS